MLSRIKYIRGWEPGGAGLSLRALLLFISEGGGTRGEQKSGSLPESGHQRRSEAHPSGRGWCWPHPGARQAKGLAFPRKGN